VTVARPRKKIRAIVPKVVFSTVFVGVVPTCIVAACSNNNSAFGVAKECFETDPCFPPRRVPEASFSVAQACFDACSAPIDAADGAMEDGSDDEAGDAADDGADGAG
jgi:hypothetical protein